MTTPEQREPKRIQRRRTKGWKRPENCVIVTRPSRFGNPFTADQFVRAGLIDYTDLVGARKLAVEFFRIWLVRDDWTVWPGTWQESVEARQRLWQVLPELVGKDLACYCPLPVEGEPDHCHAAVLIELVRRLPDA